VKSSSTVNICALDISKAFDKVDHFALLQLLMDRHVTSATKFYRCIIKLVYEMFLADRTNGRAIGTVLRLSVCRPSVTLCIVAKRCVLEQKLLLRAYRKSYMRNRLVPK